MDKYIKQLLETESKVILPSFGAIVVENEETGNLMFNEYLNYNDGKLDELIVEESNMELQEAQNTISKYIRDIKAQLDKGESYDIFELGKFFKNDKGEIEFEGNIKEGVSPKKKEVKDSKKTEKVAPKAEDQSSKSTKESPKEPVKETSKEAKTPNVSKENKYVEKKAKEDAKAKANAAKADKKAEALKKKNDAKKAAKEKKEAAKREKAAKKNANSDGKVEKKKKKIGAFFWVAIIVLALFAAGGIYVGLNYEETKAYMGWDQFEKSPEITPVAETKTEIKEEVEEIEEKADSISQTVATTEGDETASKTQKEEKKESKPKPVQTNTGAGASGSHHLIAGSFSKLSNAEGRVESLKSKGYNARILGQFGGLHFVSAKSYNSSKEARDDINRVRQDVDGAWVFKYSK